MLRWRAFSLFLVCAACNTSLDCTEIGCFNGFSITVSAAQAPDAGPASQQALPAGDYEIELSLDGTLVFCRWTLPRTQDVPYECDDRSVWVGPITSSERTSAGFQLEVNQTPRVVSAIVRHQGSVLAQDTFTPSYLRSAPNGEACGPVCNAAEQPLRLSF